MPIEAMVSDLGQVLLPFDTRRVWERLLAACSVSEEEMRREHNEAFRALRFDIGGCSGEAFHARLVERCGLRLSYEQFCTAWSDMFWEDRDVIRLIHQAPVRWRILLSNTNCIHWDFIRERYGHVLTPFDRCLVSHQCGLRKPDPAIFRRVIAETGLPPNRHLFIDDMEENVLAARAVGMDAIAHTGSEALARALAERGLSPPLR
ncbi:MAG: HAD family phosphatase [Armatimonadetes bacterium]|nr:HAD family phosphatase [Armatimonadota bacterium]